MIDYDTNYSTTRRVIKADPQVIANAVKQSNKPEDKFETVLFLSEGEGRQGEGGLRTKGYFKVGGIIGEETVIASDTPVIASEAKQSTPEAKPLITVVTVVYNGEKFLEETILSVINQTYDNVEYIIIDGGSTDGTLDIIKKYEHAIDYWVSEKDKGIYDAMNKGIDIATGEWINFMNAGDGFSSAGVAKHVCRAAFTSYVDLVYGAFNLAHQNKLQEVKPKKFSKLSLSIWGTRALCHQAIFVKQSLISKYTTKYRLKGELAWYFDLVNKKPTVCVVDFPIVNYSLGGVGDVNYKLNMIESVKVNFKQNIFVGLLSLPLLVFKYICRMFK